MTEWIEFDLEGADVIDLRLMRIEEAGAVKLRGILEGMANYSVHWMRIYAPSFSGYLRRHIGTSQARWMPGGAGGGGSWEVSAGVRRGDSRHPLYVEGGTGLYGFRRDTIKPLHAKFMMWYRFGRWHRARETKGQRAQPFLYMAFQQTKLYAHARMLTLGRELLH